MQRLFKTIGVVTVVTLTLAAVASAQYITTISDRVVCANALNRERSAWDQNPGFSEYVAEAARRRLSITDCRQTLERLARPNSELTSQSSGVCSGVLTRSNGDLAILSEPEGICIISREDEKKTLAICSEGRRCEITGVFEDCKDSGECSELRTVTSIKALFSYAPAEQEQYQWEFPDARIAVQIFNITERTVVVELYSQNRRGKSWGPYDIAAYRGGWDVPNKTIDCKETEKICIGAWDPAGDMEWGFGRGDRGCDNCCIRCDDRGHSWQLSKGGWSGFLHEGR